MLRSSYLPFHYMQNSWCTLSCSSVHNTDASFIIFDLLNRAWNHTYSHEKITGHRETTVTTVVTAPGPNDQGSVTARRGDSSITARSRLGHSEVTAQSRHLQYDHGSVTARPQLNHGPGHSSVTAGCDHFGHRELTVSSPWAVTVANFFLMGS